jgi:hypothetical protein
MSASERIHACLQHGGDDGDRQHHGDHEQRGREVREPVEQAGDEEVQRPQAEKHERIRGELSGRLAGAARSATVRVRRQVVRS